MIPRSPLGPALALAALAVAAHGQYAPAEPVEHPGKLEWPLDPQGNGTYRIGRLGDFDGDGVQDCAVLRDTRAEFLFGPGLYGALVGLAPAVTDMAVQPGEGGQDALVTVGAAGLLRYQWNGTALTWDTKVYPEDDAWLDAELVRIRPVDGPHPDIVGLMKGRTAVRAQRHDGLTYEDGELFAVPTPVIDIAILDRDGDGLSEIAVLESARLSIWSEEPGATSPTFALEQEWTVPPGFTSVAIAAGAQSGTPGQWLAWLVTGSNGLNQFISCITAAGPTQPRYLTGNPYAVAMACGDWNGDGSSDLFLSWKISQRVGILTNLGAGSPDFSAFTALTTLAASDTPDALALKNEATPAIGDVDNDGDDDVCFAVQDKEHLFVGLNDAVSASEQMPPLGASSPGPGGPQPTDPPDSESALQGPSVWLDEKAGLRELAFDVHHSATASIPPTANRVEVLVWRRPAGGPTQSQAFHQELIAFDPADPPAAGHSVRVALDEAWPLPSMYFWLQRYVEYDATLGVVRAVFPAVVRGIHGQGDPFDPTNPYQPQAVASRDQLLAWMGYGEFPVLGYISTLPPLPPAPDILGGGLALPCLPNLCVDDPPRRP